MSEDNSATAGAVPFEPAVASLIAAATEAAEWLEAIIEAEFKGGCNWPDVDGTVWCSRMCITHGCAKSRSWQCRRAIAATVLPGAMAAAVDTEEQVLGSSRASEQP